MMPGFRYTTIKAKLMALILVTCGVALLVSVTLFGINDITAFHTGMVRDLRTLADIIGANASSALDFDDEPAATRTLATLEHKPNILSAIIYTREGKVLASYFRPGHRRPAQLPAPGTEGYEFKSGHLILFQPIVRAGESIGTIYLQLDMSELRSLLLRYAGIGAVILLGALLVAVMVSSRLQQSVSKPILELARTAQTVSIDKNYSVRARKHQDDELGSLIDRFNEMLAQIEKREQELKKVNEQLVESEQRALAGTQAKSQFLANMSHELRTPLNAIIGYSEMLQEEAQDLGHEAFFPDLKKINSAGKHLLDLINDILDLSKIEAGKMDLYLEAFDLSTLLEDVHNAAQLLAHKKSNQLQFRLAKDLGVMRADLTKVRQCLFNLLSNACKFTEHGTVTLEAVREPGVFPGYDWITFRVKDTGIGMTSEQIKKLFQAFTQADTATVRRFGGTGLGLTITRHFCRMMGGEVEVASESGKGSTFTMRLPSEVREPGVDETAAGTSEAGDPAAAGQRAQPTILVIDDDPAARDLLQRSLSKDGFRVQTAVSGPQGLELARHCKPVAITLDVMMPGMDGWAVLSALKADPDLAAIPVIMMTVLDDKNQGYALGATEYFTKPIDWNRLAVALHKYRKGSDSHLVLIAEDDPAAREVMERTLGRQGWQVITAANGRIALERVTEKVPDLILLDLMMPEMDGFAFVEELRRREDCRQTPVIVITARDLTEQDRQRLTGRVERVIQKSGTSLDQVLREVRTILSDSARRGAPAINPRS